MGPISITGFSAGTPVGGQALPSQNLSVTDALGKALGTVVISNGLLALKHMTIPASFAKSTCQLVITLDGFVWTSSDFTVQ